MPIGDRALERGLWKAVQAGDEAAWRAWYEASFEAPCARYAPVGIPASRFSARDVADDIVQETWLTAVRRLGGFDPERASFVTWLRGIAGNLARNHFRKEKRRPTRPLTDMPAPGDSTVQCREQAERIAEALAGLPKHYEAVLRAKYLDQESVADIAAAQNETVNGRCRTAAHGGQGA